jgi:hypothetical protein
MRKSFFALYTILILTSLSGFSQALKNFTSEPKKFLEEMQSFLEETNKKESEEIISKFSEVWTSAQFQPAWQEAVMRTSNAMLRKRMKAFPDFKNYLAALVSFVSGGGTALRFEAWQQSLDKVILLSSKNFATYMIASNSMFARNSLYESASTRWFSDNNDYSFEFDSLPKIVFPTTNLFCASRGDTSQISATKGVFYPTLKLFYGQGGTVNWQRAGFDPATVRAQLSRYTIDITGSDYKADSVSLTHRSYFQKPLIGTFMDKLIVNSGDNVSYPRFTSYTTSLDIKNVVPDVDYHGGFSIAGNKIVGSGNKESDAQIFFYRDKKPMLIASSKAFIIRNEKITADDAGITIYFEKDSVHHPELVLKYIVKDRELTLIRGEEGKNQSPFTSSFHQVDMIFDALYWKIDEPLMDIKMITGVGENKALFESANYFRKKRFLKVQGLSPVHPFYTLQQYAKKNNSNVVYTLDLAKSMRMSEYEVRQMLITLSNEGYVIYDATDDKALLKDKLNYYLLANSGKTDYDIIEFESLIRGKSNATVNLLNFETTVRGVSRIILSDSQNVVIYPKDQEIVLQKNRDFIFSGKVKAGRFEFYGKEFKFEYDNFKINLNNVDSLQLTVEEDSIDIETGQKKLKKVKSVLEHITGDLIVDFPGNKSGLVDYPQYPIFNSQKDSYVYYDKPSIWEGAYKREEFYFHLDPFTIDSLDNFSKAGVQFGGEFVSAGIFPDFRDSLALQPDFSLGLTRTTDASGLPAYGGKGTYTNFISLSNQGLEGKGTLEYLASTTYSNDIIFLPDSMDANVDTFANRKEIYKGVEFPDVKGKDVYVHWLPKKDSMTIAKKAEPISMYETQAMLSGNLLLQPSGLTGSGIMAFSSSELESNLFKYKQNTFDADTADFRLTVQDMATLAFSSNNVKSHIDFSKRVGNFKSNEGGSYIRFPLNQYIGFIDQYTWWMDKKEIEMTASADIRKNPKDTAASKIDLQPSEFMSLEARQDSLRFIAPYAKYSLNDYLIQAEKVTDIQTADATVVPDSGKVVIEQYAKMRTLNNALVTANNTTKYHKIYNASINILGRKKYEGSGDYDYIDEEKVKHHLHLDRIGVDSAYQTIADGEILDTIGFQLSHQFDYKGNVHLIASNEFLTFNGYVRPNFRCDSIAKNWIRFSNEINPAKVQIPVDGAITDNGEKLYSAIIQSSQGMYATFLGPKRAAADVAILDAKGILTYDKLSGKFIITTREKADKPELSGNYMSLDDAKCLVYAQGKLQLDANFGQVEMETAGAINYNLNNDSILINVMIPVNFYFSEEALKIMADNVMMNTALNTGQNNAANYERSLTELVGKEKADKMLADLNLYGTFKKMPEELQITLLLTDVKLIYNKIDRTFQSSGPFGINIIDKNYINKYVKGTVEVAYKRTGNALTIYFELDNKSWFYFNYTRGLMQAISSVSGFNEAIEKVKPEKRTRSKKDLPDYEYLLSTDRAVKNFLRKLSAPSTPKEEEPQEENK